MKKIFLILNSAFLIFNYSLAQPAIQWQKCLGGTNADNARAVQQTTDGGYIVAGRTFSYNGDVIGNHGTRDYWVVKLDSSGNIQWQKCLGGTGNDEAYAVQQTADGGYILAGFTTSNDGDVSGNHGSDDSWLVKLDGSGNIQWQKCLGGTGNDEAYSVQQTADGGYITAGATFSYDGDVTGNQGYIDFWVIKLDSSGSIQWQKCLGGTFEDQAFSVQQTAEGGYIVAGWSNSYDGNVTDNHGDYDYWVVKLDGNGNIQWQKCLGGTSADRPYSVQQTADGGYIVAGYVESNDGDVTGFHGALDYWIVKLDGNGNIQWQKCLGGTGNDWAASIEQTADGGYTIAGHTGSNDGDVTAFHGVVDYWIVKLDGSGNLQWQKCLGGTNYDAAWCVHQTADEGYIIAGWTNCNDGDVTGNHGIGVDDYWVVKLSSYVGIEEAIFFPTISISPNPFTSTATITFNKEVHNATFSLYNLLGEKVAEVEGISGENFQFNRGNLGSGVYVFEVNEKEKKIARGKAVVY